MIANGKPATAGLEPAFRLALRFAVMAGLAVAIRSVSS